MIVLGVDPGSQRTGWGVIKQEGSRTLLVAVGVLKPLAGAPVTERLQALHAGLAAVLAEHRPGVVGMETVFHGPNTRSLVTLGQARGALLAAVGAAGIALDELSPAEVKKAVTGRGGAAKEQVSHMVGVLLGGGALVAAAEHGGRGRLDATDALAVALAALHRVHGAWARATGVPGVGAPGLARRVGRRKSSSRGLFGKGGGGFYARSRATSAE